MRIVSGIQPTGPLHIGNYLGAISQWKKLQLKHDCFFFVADYHSLTENFDPKKKSEQIYLAAAEMLAAGLDPKKCTIFVQSDVPEVTELAWIFNTLVTMPELSRMTQFKDKASRQEQNINVGLFDYPVLQAADILIYDGEAVPVGVDQIQHIEFTRDIARAFNNRFSAKGGSASGGDNTFIETKPLLSHYPRVMSLLEPEKKMSKSLGEAHYIALSDSPEIIAKKLARAVTDTGPISGKIESRIAPAAEIRSPLSLQANASERGNLPPSSRAEPRDLPVMSSGVRNLFELLKYFGTKNDFARFEASYTNGSIRYSDLKTALAEKISNYFADFRSKRARLLGNKSTLQEILARGSKKARALAQKKMRAVRKSIGLIH